MKKKLLIIEDQAPMRRNIALLLEIAGYEVITAEDGRAGIEMAKQHRPDLVLCDVTMPKLDGYGVVGALRADPEMAMIPFIFLTAKGDKADIRSGMNLGADDYLVKPASREELLSAVQARLARAAAVDARLESAGGMFQPNFKSAKPLEELGLTAREAEVLLWVAQGKSNADVGVILTIAEATVKQHMGMIFQKLGVDNRNAATLTALQKLSRT